MTGILILECGSKRRAKVQDEADGDDEDGVSKMIRRERQGLGFVYGSRALSTAAEPLPNGFFKDIRRETFWVPEWV